MLQVSLPLFYGCHRDYDTWEKSIENLFVLLNKEKESEKIALAVGCFRSSALNWWKLVSNIYSHHWYRNLDDWLDLRNALRERYAGTNTFDEAKVRLLNCKQNGRSVQSYFEELEGVFLSSGVDENDYMLTDRFHYGLDKGCFRTGWETGDWLREWKDGWTSLRRIFLAAINATIYHISEERNRRLFTGAIRQGSELLNQIQDEGRITILGKQKGVWTDAERRKLEGYSIVYQFYQGDGHDYSSAFATDETFGTKPEAIAYAKDIANMYNMELSVFSHKDNNTILFCHKGGWYPGQQVDENMRARPNTKTQMTGCQFRVTVYKIYDRRPLSAEVKELIQEYSKVGTKAIHILRAIWTQFSDENITSKQVYNYRNQLRKEGFLILDDMASMDIVGKVLEVAEQHKYIIFTECDEETQREKLQESRQKIGRQHNKYPFYQLRCNVSHYCLDLLNNELERAQQLGDDVFWECNHYLKQTHLIPCTCILKRVMEDYEVLTPKYLHKFWNTLDIGQVAEKDSSDDVSAHRLLFRQLVEELDAAKDPIQREITRLMYNKLHPGQARSKQLRVGKRDKGRPKKGGISKRKQDKPNVWAYRDGNQDGTNTSDSNKAGTSKGTWTGLDGMNTSSSSRGHTSGSEAHVGDVMQTDFSKFRHKNKIQQILHNHVQSYLDVQPDSNFGFRVIASCMLRGQNNHVLCRQIVFDEVINNPGLYRNLYGWDKLAESLKRLRWIGISEVHWMSTEDFYPIAIYFNVVVYYFRTNGTFLAGMRDVDGTDVDSMNGCEWLLYQSWYSTAACPTSVDDTGIQ
ncbi:OLC1v1001070C1 [Oldenlandia corymbosa var. corymbosa]|uniref:OLC1v1001070C1 n=1 Tax=Oldenlandia corymbosa var. corymbosa TaxID=529605 RepID=A0AAV1D5K7_OLDCO|nr:OLC1v1001070C1 [Oldenlandia corymbosa var. corymbosa]